MPAPSSRNLMRFFPSFRYRTEAQDAVSAMVWPDLVHTQSARPAWLPTKAASNQRRRRRGRLEPTSPAPVVSASVTSRRCLSKAIFPGRWQSGIESSTRSSVCSAAPLTTFSRRGLDGNNRWSTYRPAASMAFVAQQPSFSAQWSCRHGLSAPRLSVIPSRLGEPRSTCG